MSKAVRIERHRETVARLREDIELVQSIGLSDTLLPGETTTGIVAQLEATVSMYERFILRLEGRGDA